MRFSVGTAIRVEGTVQGVGFRPFVRNLAVKLGLSGDVRNDAQGVFIRIFGDSAAIGAFQKELMESPPPLAVIRKVSTEQISAESPSGFHIVLSDAAGARTVAVTPDAAVCKDCLRELFDPADRRYRYPFINCTHCGPRYTIIEDVPYDRPNTTMRDFDMCPECRAEYENPADRRFHAQPVCCPKCGPTLQLLDSARKSVPGEPIKAAAELLRKGKIVAVKGLGGFHLACDAKNQDAVLRLRQRKHRDEKPFAVMAANWKLAETLVEMPEYGKKLFSGPAAPILIAPKKRKKVREACILAPAVAPVTSAYGVMLPYTPLHALLFAEGLDFLVMTSANKTDEPICIDNEEAFERLDGIADCFLVHNRRIQLRADDSVVLASEGRPTVIRRARGYAPMGVDTGIDVDGIAGFGPQMKNTLAIGRGTEIYPGQHVGDLDNLAALGMFDEVYEHLRLILGVKVRVIACDLHPDYASTRLAETENLPIVRVQHHHAHLVSLMAETRAFERSIGFAFDGTGYGDDGEVWGGEVMVFEPASYRRAFHLEYVPLPGGDAAAREPWRMSLAYLMSNGFDWRKYVRAPNAPAVAAMLESKMELRRTSSMGRLFDAVAGLCGLCDVSTFEAKAPMALEGVYEPADGHYDFTVVGTDIQTGGIIRGVVRDVDRGERVSVISGRFHATIAEIMAVCAKKLRDAEKLGGVFLSGGCFVNARLLSLARRRLHEEGFEVFTHAVIPPNDGGVSAGQVLSAAFRR